MESHILQLHLCTKGAERGVGSPPLGAENNWAGGRSVGQEWSQTKDEVEEERGSDSRKAENCPL